MPVYEFKCRQCNEVFELKLSIFHTKKAEKCPKCGTDGARRILFSTGAGGSAPGSCSSQGYR